ncbi:MAG: 6-carboxytetrahydropterin synthase [Oscillospiraceae bacterium]|nr:6-carboxytetrahydropterin synthase [Oscillospiraceae bacterium]
MYAIKTEASFDSAHFLHGYDGKCKNIHGHSFKVSAVAESPLLLGGMVADFSVFKSDLKKITENLDHALIYEDGTLKPETVSALNGEGFKLTPLPFRPTAENLAEYFYSQLKNAGYNVKKVSLYETEKNCAEFYMSERERTE